MTYSIGQEVIYTGLYRGFRSPWRIGWTGTVVEIRGPSNFRVKWHRRLNSTSWAHIDNLAPLREKVTLDTIIIKNGIIKTKENNNGRNLRRKNESSDGQVQLL